MLRPWPVNVRQLHNALTDALVTAGVESSAEVLPRHLEPASAAAHQLSHEDLERAQLVDALRRTNGNVVEAARVVGVSKSTFYEKLARYGINRR